MELALGINQGKNLSLICNMWELHHKRARSLAGGTEVWLKHSTGPSNFVL